MRPLLIDVTLPLLGRTTLPAYFTLLTLGFALAMLLTVREASKIHLDPQEVLDINLYMIIFGIIGARILHILADGHLMDYINLCLDPKKVPAIDALVRSCTTDKQCGYDYLCDTARRVCYPPQDCLAWAKLWRGGLAYYGGFLLASAYCIYYTRRRRIPTMRIGDLAAPAIMLGLFFGRMGCYLNGCCYGKVTTSILGTRFPVGSIPWRAQYEAKLIQVWEPMRPVHPTQLYEALGCLAIFAVLYYLVRPRKRMDGHVFGAMLILYALVRSLCEIFRDDERGVLWGWLSTSQIISAPLLVVGLWLVLRRRPAPLPA
ncbi:MAG: prolipoprotein diacylglyceryl transferase [Myxococcales bacterium]|nr:prolipoprotein diacylglyceryl transferase [Myxococcota bacterium]MDW8283266.1 prolipoprotein diacylglyceryl transferase [Myxococcales bacterium]